MFGTNDSGRDYIITIGSQTYVYPDGRTTLEGTYNGETLNVAAGGRSGKFCNNGDGTDCQDTVIIN